METIEIPQDATSHYLKMLTFRQYMRSQNEEDEELIRKIAPVIPIPEGWDIEDHLEDLRPGIWIKKDKHVIMVYSSMGMIAVCFGEMRSPSTMPEEGHMTTQDTRQQDFSMVFPIFPPEDIPYINEKDDEKKEDFVLAQKKLEDFMTGCIEYISSASRDGSALEKKKSKEAKDDLGINDKQTDKNPSVSDSAAETTPIPAEKRF